MVGEINIDPGLPHAFLSYTRFDDRFLNGGISALREALEQAVQARTGEPFNIFQDVDDIKPGDPWRTKLDQAIQAAQLFIPVLTPNFFTSDFCRREAKAFLEYEARAGRDDLVLPIYLIDDDRMEDSSTYEADDLARQLRDRQYSDWRALRFQLQADETRHHIFELAGSIASSIAKTNRIAQGPIVPTTGVEEQLSKLNGTIAKLEKTLETETTQNQELQAALSKQEQAAKQLAEDRAVFQGQAEEALSLKREVEALRLAQKNDQEAPSIPRDMAPPQQLVPETAGFRPLHAFGIAWFALLIGVGGGWLLRSDNTNPEASTATIEAMQSRIADLEGQVEEKNAEVADFEAKLEEMKGPGVEEGRVAELTNEVDELKRRLEASEQHAAAQEEQLSGMRWALAEAQTALSKRTSKAASQTEAGDTFRDCSECPEMVVIPAGEFLMGSPEGEAGRHDDEGPQHRVTISRPFALGKYEVTFDEWDACVAAGGCDHTPGDEGWGRDDRPVINVSWNDAKQYCGWLSETTGRKYRLPSEAEWEYAARAGTQTAYFWGDEIGKNRANCHECGSEWDGMQTALVGSFDANAFGLSDIHGNVWEWLEDSWHGSYENAPADGHAWPSETTAHRVLRGGSWGLNAQFLRSARRYSWTPGSRLNGIGFRCARVQE